MLDQIKFRGQLRIRFADKQPGNWIETNGMYPIQENIPNGMDDYIYLLTMADFWDMVKIKSIDPATVGQWSGWKATNGEDIYAGHYVRVEFPRDDTPGCVIEGVVVMFDGVFWIDLGGRGRHPLYKCYSRDIEIIKEIIEEASDG